MKTIELDGRKMNNEEMVHLYLKLKLDAPEYLGNNLDALWDTLISYDKDVKVNIIYSQYLLQNLDEYGLKILNLFLEAGAANENITVEVKKTISDVE